MDLALEPGDFIGHTGLNHSSTEILWDEEADAGPRDRTQMTHEETEDAAEDRTWKHGEKSCARYGKRLEATVDQKTS